MSRRGLLAGFAVLVATVSLLATPTVPGEAASPEVECRMPSTTNLNPDRKPLLLVHGWMGTPSSLEPVKRSVESRMPGEFDFRYFDYSRYRQRWAAHPAIAGCLGVAVNRLSTAHKEAGGDGRIYFVAHSMGGLAIRFATSAQYTQEPIEQDTIGGIVTIGTPHQGSMWGNSPGAALVGESIFPPAWPTSTDGWKCLARHDQVLRLPAGCATPPYLPAKTNLAMLGGENTIKRMWFDIELYRVDLFSDGIVRRSSAQGYLDSGPTGEEPALPTAIWPQASTVKCVGTTNDPALTSTLIDSGLGLGLLFGGGIHDEVGNEKLSPRHGVLSLAAYLQMPCGHGALLTHPGVLDQTGEALQQWLDEAETSSQLEASATGLGEWEFGDSAGQVLDGLQTRLGEPDLDTGWTRYQRIAGQEGWFASSDHLGNSWDYPLFRATCWTSLCVIFGGTDETQAAFRGWELSTFQRWNGYEEVDPDEPGLVLSESGIALGDTWAEFSAAYPDSVPGGGEGNSLVIDNPPWTGIFDGVWGWRMTGQWSPDDPEYAPPTSTITRMSAGEGPEPGCC